MIDTPASAVPRLTNTDKQTYADLQLPAHGLGSGSGDRVQLA